MGEPEVTIRRAKARDMAFIVELWKKLAREMADCDERYALRSEAEIIWAKWAGERLRDQASCVLVAEAGADYVGYLLGHIGEAQPIFKQRTYAVITDVFVDPELRRKGIGRRLVEEAVSFFKSREISHVRASVLVKNETARPFWQKLGFGDFIHRTWKSI